MWMRDAVHAEQVPDDQAADDGSALLPVSLRPGAVGLRRRTLGRPRDRRGLPHRAPPRLGRGARSRARREPGLAVEGLGRGEPGDVSCRRSPDARIRTASAPSSWAFSASGDYNLAPTISPDGKLFAFFSSRNLFSIDLLVGDANDRQDHQEARRSVERSALRRDQLHQLGRRLVAGRRQVRVHRLRRGRERDRDPRHEVDERRAAHQAAGHRRGQLTSRGRPTAATLAFSGQAGGISDLYLLDLEAGTISQLTNDRYADIQPTWSPDGKTIAFSTDRGAADRFQRRSSSRRCSSRRTTSRRDASASSRRSRTASTSTRSSRRTARICSSSPIRTASPTSIG